MPQTPSSSNNELAVEGFDKAAWYKELKIQDDPLGVSGQEIAQAMLEAGQIVRKKYGDHVFERELGRKINADLKNLGQECQFRVVDSDFLMIITGVSAGYQVEVAFRGRRPLVAIVEGKSRLNQNLGLKFLEAGE
jgi:hypothetical protein